MIILGIDPGYAIVGWGVIDYKNNTHTPLAFGAITTEAHTDFNVRLKQIYDDMTELINGGPLTLEIHDTVLRNDIGIKKTAALVKAFIDLGGHQLQLNSINRERLIDAREHPEKYPNLIVRVWGWSGRWNELGKEYQDHIIKRVEFSV